MAETTLLRVCGACRKMILPPGSAGVTAPCCGREGLCPDCAPPDRHNCEALAKAEAEAATRAVRHARGVRAVIRKHLAALADDLDRFEQTTHGHLSLGGVDAGVGRELTDCYGSPTAFNISNLSQAIGQLLRIDGVLDGPPAPRPSG